MNLRNIQRVEESYKESFSVKWGDSRNAGRPTGGVEIFPSQWGGCDTISSASFF
jgi:hypothetical protein